MNHIDTNNSIITEEIKVSVVVPVYNVEPYLTRCIESLLNQTLKEIEIILVEDCSNDGSRNIVEAYSAKDDRIKVIYHETNLSTSQSRKDGVALSSGKYIMFLDGDDYFSADACAVAYAAILASGTNMLQFGTEIVNCGNFPESKLQMLEKFLKPCVESFYDADILHKCFIDKYFGFTLWNKIYQGDLCRNAFSCVEDGAFPKANDLYAFFILAHKSASYAGIENRLYHYSYGTGITGQKTLSMHQFKMLLTQKKVYDAVRRYAVSEHIEEDTDDILNYLHEHFLHECTDKWVYQLSDEYCSTSFDLMADTWGYKNVLCTCANDFWYNRAEIARKMSETAYVNTPVKPKNKKRTIAAYYRNIKNGGVQRVVSHLCNLWAEQKDADGEPLYNIILITNEETEDNENISDYPLHPNVIRTYLPNREVYIKKQFGTVYDAWYEMIEKYDIDLIIDSLYVAPFTLWDILCIKGHPKKPAFVMHCHNFTCTPYKFEGTDALTLLSEYKLCDGVVVLSECDQALVSRFTGYCKCILNPLTFAIDYDSTNTKEKNTIVWVGRISEEKRPLDAIYMMDKIVEQLPDARLYLVGDGNTTLITEMKQLISHLKLDKNIILTGYSSNVKEYYQKASVVIVTSEYESFSLTIGEAFAHGLPVITYDMPWLSFLVDGRGITTVKQGRPDLLAQEAIKLLSNEDLYKEKSKEAYRHIEDFMQIDLTKEWVDFFTGVYLPHADVKNSKRDDLSIIIEYITKFQNLSKTAIKDKLQEAIRKLNRTSIEKNELDQKLQKTYTEKSALNQKLQKTYAEKSELNHKLQETYAEKSELNKKLKQTYAEKSERGKKITELEKKIASLEKELRATQSAQRDAEQKYNDILQSRTYQAALKMKKIIKPFH